MQFTVIFLILVKLLKFSAEASMCGTESYSIYTYKDDASCFWIKEPNNDLPLLDEKNDLMEGSIFFLDTSCKRGLNVREACSVEAAAKVNPKRQVNVFFTGPVSKQCLQFYPLSSLQTYKNIKLRRIYIDEYVNKTGFEEILKSTVINDGPYPNLYALDLLKYITLYKFDGIYMDLDILATRPFDKLPKSKNWVGVEDHEQKSLSTSIFAASSDDVGRKFIGSVIRILLSSLDTEEWSYDNFNVLRVALEQTYGSIPFQKTKDGISFTKHDLNVYARKFFIPVKCEESDKYFDSKLDISNLTLSYTQLLCSGMTSEDNVTENSIYAQLMKKYCPKVYKYFASTGFQETRTKKSEKTKTVTTPPLSL